MRSLDPRLTLALGDAAALALEGVRDARRYLAPEPMQAAVGTVALRREPSPDAEQLDQLLWGERFDVLERRGAFAFGQAARDGYVGWVATDALAPAGDPPTHWVSALRAHAFAAPSIKSAPVIRLSMNALVRAGERDGRFVRVEGSGWVVDHQLRPIGDRAEAPAEVARRFLGTSYLWGGRDSVGLDCSGLVQQALYACGRGCPRDSDQQQRLGRAAERDVLQAGDLVFWPGHVGMMLDPGMLIHANAFHMAVASEPLAETIARVGEPTGYRRP